MATIFLGYSPTNRPLDLSDSIRSAVRAAMKERRPGTLKEFGSGSWLCLVGGDDGAGFENSDTFLAADGEPTVTHSAGSDPMGTSLGTLAQAWRAGGQALLPALDGSFALLILDRLAGRLTLVRDRFGSRPLHWVAWGGGIFAASECKILACLGIPLRIARPVLEEVLVCRWILGESHLLSPIKQVPAASAVTVRVGENASVKKYWRLPFAPERGGAHGLTHFRDLTRGALRESISEAARGRGKVGILLSGGVDSSVIAGVAREAVGQCVGFVGRIPDTSNVETARALAVARHLDIECQVVDVSPPAFGDDLRAMVRRIEQPPRHPNNFVLQQLYERAASEVDLVLHGDGAEMLFGLSDVKRVARFRRKRAAVAPMPAALRKVMGRALRSMEDGRAERLARVLTWDATAYAAMLDAIIYSIPVQRSLRHLLEGGAPQFLPTEHFTEHEDFSDALQAYQAFTFLVVSLLRHDRLAQPLGIVAESPFLRSPVVDVACRLPYALRYTDGPKPALRALCDFYLPPEVSRWPKMGFPVPWQTWMARSLPDPTPLAEHLSTVLPPGFLEGAVAARDAEAMWTAATLGILAAEFCVAGENGSCEG